METDPFLAEWMRGGRYTTRRNIPTARRRFAKSIRKRSGGSALTREVEDEEEEGQEERGHRTSGARSACCAPLQRNKSENVL